MLKRGHFTSSLTLLNTIYSTILSIYNFDHSYHFHLKLIQAFIEDFCIQLSQPELCVFLYKLPYVMHNLNIRF